MKTARLTNYLRSYRKRSGLTQHEVAFLAGLKSDARLSMIEKRGGEPRLRAALALAAIFAVPVEELFAGLRESVAEEVEARVAELAMEITPKVGKDKGLAYHAAHKLSKLREWRSRAPSPLG